MTRREKNSAEPASVPDRDELLELLGQKAREGNVQAIKALLEEQRRNADSDTSETTGVAALYADDELAKRRRRAS